MTKILILIVFIAFLSFYCLNNTVAKVIAGEACGEGYKGMYAVACVIQNRAKIRNKSPYEIVTQKNQFASLHNPKLLLLYLPVIPITNYLSLRIGTLKDITKGATMFENIERFGFPKTWNRRKIVKTCKIGRHTYFREIK